MEEEKLSEWSSREQRKEGQKHLQRYENSLRNFLKSCYSFCTYPDCVEERNDKFGDYQYCNEGHTRKATAKFVDYFLVELSLVTEAPHEHHDAYCPLQNELSGDQ